MENKTPHPSQGPSRRRRLQGHLSSPSTADDYSPPASTASKPPTQSPVPPLSPPSPAPAPVITSDRGAPCPERLSGGRGESVGRYNWYGPGWKGCKTGPPTPQILERGLQGIDPRGRGNGPRLTSLTHFNVAQAQGWEEWGEGPRGKGRGKGSGPNIHPRPPYRINQHAPISGTGRHPTGPSMRSNGSGVGGSGPLNESDYPTGNNIGPQVSRVNPGDIAVRTGPPPHPG